MCTIRSLHGVLAFLYCPCRPGIRPPLLFHSALAHSLTSLLARSPTLVAFFCNHWPCSLNSNSRILGTDVRCKWCQWEWVWYVWKCGCGGEGSSDISCLVEYHSAFLIDSYLNVVLGGVSLCLSDQYSYKCGSCSRPGTTRERWEIMPHPSEFVRWKRWNGWAKRRRLSLPWQLPTVGFSAGFSFCDDVWPYNANEMHICVKSARLFILK